MMFSSLATLIVVIGLASADHGKLPDQILKCRRSDPNLNGCLIKAVQSAIPVLSAGIPKLGILPVEPLSITQLNIKQDTGPVPLNIKFKNIAIKGFGSSIVTGVQSDFDNYKLTISSRNDKPILFEADYELKGNVLILPLAGKGKSHLKLDNVKSDMVLTGKGIKKNGKTYFDLTDFDVEVRTSKLHMNFENLISENKALGDNVNAFLNENWQEILKEVYPAVKEALGAAFKEIGHRIFSKVPVEELFLP